jgi:hypothetical protein
MLNAEYSDTGLQAGQVYSAPSPPPPPSSHIPRNGSKQARPTGLESDLSIRNSISIFHCPILHGFFVRTRLFYFIFFLIYIFLCPLGILYSIFSGAGIVSGTLHQAV